MSMLKPISIGPVTIDAPVILAPMTGVTDLPFRKVVKRFGAGLTVSEMIASQAMIRETRQSLQKAAWDPSEEPVSLQLAGCGPVEMAEAAKLNEQRGAAILDAAVKAVSQSAEAGAWPTLMAATADLPGGTYVGPTGPGQGRGSPGIVGSTPLARDEMAQRRLWETSEETVGLTWP